MISRLRGTLIEKNPPYLVIEAGGVGYEVTAPLSVFGQLPQVGQPITLLIHFQVREDAHLLFGFAHERERTLFRCLIKVSGIGPKVALAILSALSPDEFAQAIQSQDLARLECLPGIGKKTAQRLIVEMRDRLTLDSAYVSQAEPLHNLVRNAEVALQALGFKPAEATRMVAKVKEPCERVETLVRLALRGKEGAVT